MRQGDRVLANEKIETIFKIEPSRIITFESAKINSWYHPSKVKEMEWSKPLKRWIIIPED